MGLNEFAGYFAVAGSALATGLIASRYGLRPEPFYLGVGFVAFGLLLSAFVVRETKHHVAAESKLHGALPAVGTPTQREVFWRTTWTDRDLSAVTQAGLVNNLNDGMSWGLFPLIFAGAGLGLAQIGWLAAVPIVTCLPFLIWDARTFLDDTLLWTGRAGASAYPLKWVGWGLSVLAYGIDLVEHPLGANPFGVAGGIAQLFMLIVGLQAVRREPTPTRVFAIGAMMLTTMLLFARAYSMSYPVVPFCLIGLAALLELRARRGA